MTQIAIFASGSGTNARKIIEYSLQKDAMRVALVVTNNPQSGVTAIAREFDIPVLHIKRDGFYNTTELLDMLRQNNIEGVVLAGFLWLVPPYLIQAFPRKILNIHPALLPKYGGKGMYGHFVHEAVKAAGDVETGITIHFANEQYDEGDIVFQATCPVLPDDTPADIARKVQVLEHQYFPVIVERCFCAPSQK
jgi:phosphoribosylglycinamide formyltransferase 1